MQYTIQNGELVCNCPYIRFAVCEAIFLSGLPEASCPWAVPLSNLYGRKNKVSIQQIQVFFSCSSFCIAPIPAVILIQQLLNTYCMLDIKWWYLTSKNLKCRGQKGVKTEAVSAVEVWACPQTRPLLGQPRVCLAAARSAPGGHSPLAQGGAAHSRTAFSQGREGRRDGRKARRNLLAVSGQTPRRPSLKRCVFRPIH